MVIPVDVRYVGCGLRKILRSPTTHDIPHSRGMSDQKSTLLTGYRYSVGKSTPWPFQNRWKFATQLITIVYIGGINVWGKQYIDEHVYCFACLEGTHTFFAQFTVFFQNVLPPLTNTISTVSATCQRFWKYNVDTCSIPMSVFRFPMLHAG